MKDTPSPRFSVRSVLVMLTILSPVLTILASIDFQPFATATTGIGLLFIVLFYFDRKRSSVPLEPSYRKRIYQPVERPCVMNRKCKETRQSLQRGGSETRELRS